MAGTPPVVTARDLTSSYVIIPAEDDHVPPARGWWAHSQHNSSTSSVVGTNTVNDANCGEKKGSCKNDLCCSQYNYCGSIDIYCGDGCQPEYGNCHGGGGGGGGAPPPKRGHVRPPPADDSPPPCSCEETITNSSSASTMGEEKYSIPNCGKNGHHGICKDNLCCSKHGFCGEIDLYCGEGCQHGFGRCKGGGGGHHHSPPPPDDDSPPPPDDDSPPPSPCSCN
ncbi:Agglutinin isolectin 1 [Linum perenne]